MAEPNPDTVFVRTEKGIEEIRSRTVKLPRDEGLVFLSIDGKSSVAQLLPRSGMAEPQFHRTLEMLVTEGYIEAVGSRAGSLTLPAADIGESRGPIWVPQVETVRSSPVFPWSRDKPPDIDVEARARELKARVEAGRRAREEVERKSREPPQFDIPDAAEGTAQPPARPAPNVGESTNGKSDAAGTDAGRVRSGPPEFTRSAPSDVPESGNRFRANIEADSHAASGGIGGAGSATGVTAVGSGPSAPLRIEGAPPGREKLSVDRTAYDILAEAAQARRTSGGALHAQVREEYAHDYAERAAAGRRARRRVRFGIVALVLLVALPVLGVLWLQFVPLTQYVPDVQRALSEHLNQPVQLASLRYALLPTPRIVLQGVVIGRDSGVRADRIEAHASPLALLAQPKRFEAIEVKNAVIAPAMLATLPSWLGGRSASDVRISSLQLSNLRIDLPSGAIAPFDGDVSFEADGKVGRASLANDNLKIRLSPGPRGAVLKLDATAWTIPFGPPVQFSYFTAAGRLTEHELTIDEFNGRVAGGYLQANGTLRWPGPLVVHGSFALQNMRLDELLPSLTHHLSVKGVLEANGRYQMQSDSAETLLASTRMDADFRIARGELENLDLLRGFHAPGASASRGGRTPFEKLTGTFHLSPAGYQYRQVRLTSGPFNANGAFEVAHGGKLSGRVNAELVVGTHLAARSSFEVGGTVKEPVLRR